MARVLGVRMDAVVGLPAREDTPAASPPAQRPRPRKAASVGEEARWRAPRAASAERSPYAP